MLKLLLRVSTQAENLPCTAPLGIYEEDRSVEGDADDGKQLGLFVQPR
jgi:hypothetical protein